MNKASPELHTMPQHELVKMKDFLLLGLAHVSIHIRASLSVLGSGRAYLSPNECEMTEYICYGIYVQICGFLGGGWLKSAWFEGL